MSEVEPDRPKPPLSERRGPTDITDPLMRAEARRAMVWFGLAALFGLLILLAQPLLIIFGGMVFGAMIDGGARVLERVLPIGRGWRVGIVMFLAVAFVVWMALFAGSQIAAQAALLPATVEAQATKGILWLEQHGFRVQPLNLRSIADQAMNGLAQVTQAVGGIIGGVMTLFLIVVLGIYFAAEPKLYRRGLAWMLPADRRDHFEITGRIMGAQLRRLMFGRLCGMAAEALMTWIALQLYGVPMAALLGLLTGLLAFLPNIGAPISGAIMVLVGFSGGTDMGIYCMIVYAVVQTIDGNIIVPMIARKTVDLAPALVLGAQLIMGVLFGILGLALADPLVAMLKIWLEREADRQEEAENGVH